MHFEFAGAMNVASEGIMLMTAGREEVVVAAVAEAAAAGGGPGAGTV
jgi:hypothetical protein